jgi:hypothetical protein
MSDITIIFYTCNVVADEFAERIRRHLVQESAPGIRVISVSFEPMNFGDNIVVQQRPQGPSEYNVYWQILQGAANADTEYVACCEDDSLYVPAHFQFRPPKNMIAFNLNRWSMVGNNGNPIFYYRDRTVMGQCIAPRRLLVDTLSARYNKYPEYQENLMKYWGEPTRAETKLGLTPVPRLEFKTTEPTIVVKHRKSLSGVRARKPTDIIVEEMAPWGRASDLWQKFCGEGFK